MRVLNPTPASWIRVPWDLVWESILSNTSLPDDYFAANLAPVCGLVSGLTSITELLKINSKEKSEGRWIGKIFLWEIEYHYNFGFTFSSELPRANKKNSTDLYNFYCLVKSKRIRSSGEVIFFFLALLFPEECIMWLYISQDV